MNYPFVTFPSGVTLTNFHNSVPIHNFIYQNPNQICTVIPQNCYNSCFSGFRNFVNYPIMVPVSYYCPYSCLRCQLSSLEDTNLPALSHYECVCKQSSWENEKLDLDISQNDSPESAVKLKTKEEAGYIVEEPPEDDKNVKSEEKMIQKPSITSIADIQETKNETKEGSDKKSKANS